MNRSKSDVGRPLSRREILALFGGAAVGGVLSACSREPGPADYSTEKIMAPESANAPAVDRGPIHFASLTEVAHLIEKREISPVELTRLMLARIENVDAELKSYATVMADSAIAAARKAEQEIAGGMYRGPLHGIPIAVKDLCYTKGTRTMGGLAVFREFTPEFDATVVSRLAQAGTVLLGKLNLTEGAMGGYHREFDIPVNPWGAEYWSGASSSGSGVATAAGLCFASLGSDTGGSIRFPAMANGIVGLKPTYGRVSRYGVLPLGETLDHVGPMTRRVADAAIMLGAIAGFDENDPTSLREPVPDMLETLSAGVNGLRIGIDRDFASEGSDPELTEAIEEALKVLETLGASIVEVELPVEASSVMDPWFVICSYEAHQAHAVHFPSRKDEFGGYFREFLEIGAAVTDEQYASASLWRREFNQRFEAGLESVDCIVCPSGGTTFPLDLELQYGDMASTDSFFETVNMNFTIPADFAGTPTLTVPCGKSANGLPLSLQFMGKKLSESHLCRVAHAYEEATRWHKRFPPV
jgi:amidase